MKLRRNNLKSVIQTNKKDLTFIHNTLTDIITNIDPNVILQDIMGMDSVSRVAAFIRLSEANSKLAKDISSIEKDKFVMNLDKMDDDMEIFVVLDNELGVHLTETPTPNQLEVAEIQNIIFDEIISENDKDISTIQNIESKDIDISFEQIQYVQPNQQPRHTPRTRKPIGY